MLSFPLVYLLIPFAFIFLLAVLFFFFNIFHIRRYAIESRGTTLLLLAYLGTFSAIVIASGIYISNVNWQRQVQVDELIPTFDAASRI
jgi:hypothetical protein